MKTRRVVIGQDAAGRSSVISDDVAPMGHDFENLPGSALTRVWRSEVGGALAAPTGEPTSLRGPLLPLAGETSFVVMTFGPDAAAMQPGFDPMAAGQEFGEYLPDLAAAMEPDSPGMHTTDSLDYVIVLDGEVWLELDDRVQVHLAQGDVVVQVGARHAWRNRSERPVSLGVIMIGACRQDVA